MLTMFCCFAFAFGSVLLEGGTESDLSVFIPVVKIIYAVARVTRE